MKRSEYVLFAVIIAAFIAMAAAFAVMNGTVTGPKDDDGSAQTIQQQMAGLAAELNADPTTWLYTSTVTNFSGNKVFYASEHASVTEGQPCSLVRIDGVIVTYLKQDGLTIKAEGVVTRTDRTYFSSYESGLIYIKENSAVYTTDEPIPDEYAGDPDVKWLFNAKDSTAVQRMYIPYTDIQKVVRGAI